MNQKPDLVRKRILFFFPFEPGRAPSQRFRAEAYFPIIKSAGHEVAWRSFYGKGAWEILYANGSRIKKAILVITGYLKRLYQVLFVVPCYDYVFVQRETTPLGPPIVEWLIVKVWRRKLILDFDDATWIPNNSSKSKILSWLKAFWKLKYICQWSYKVAAGNDYLAAYASNYSSQVVVLPTVIDTNAVFIPATIPYTEFIIGWTGSHSTLKYLQAVVPVIKSLQQQHKFQFVVIADKRPELDLANWRFVEWNASSEIDDLRQLSIGIMPLPDDEWSKGKCGFKLIQYMGVSAARARQLFPAGIQKPQPLLLLCLFDHFCFRGRYFNRQLWCAIAI